MIGRVVAAARACGAAVTGVQVKDTLRQQKTIT
jgi:2-C-methyl-D-erythritol 4-phosphate cytidylyltransferase